MSRMRRATGTPLSLFSFQDIITSITGIMILIVLMLMLEVISRKSLDAPVTAPPPKTHAETDKPDKTASMRKEKETLLKEVERQRKAIAALPGVDPQQIKKEIERENGEQDRLTEELNRARRKSDELGTPAEKAAVMKRLQEMLARMRAEDRVIFEFDRTDKTPILVQCSREGIEVKVLEANPTTQSFISAGRSDYQSSLANFSRWAVGRNKDRDAFVLLVKPSAAPYASAVINMLRIARFDVGYEPLEEGKTAIFKDEPLP